ncbi:hypothetical protein [Pseudomonas tohonis]|nr:hypothetical protein [Pseudomonas tohonis]UXY55026.1 hypothetical protein N9L84_10820 [Pseudomonas tohonis]
MPDFSEVPAYFWLLFALAVAIAVMRELHRERREDIGQPPRRKP